MVNCWKRKQLFIIKISDEKLASILIIKWFIYCLVFVYKFFFIKYLKKYIQIVYYTGQKYTYEVCSKSIWLPRLILGEILWVGGDATIPVHIWKFCAGRIHYVLAVMSRVEVRSTGLSDFCFHTSWLNAEFRSSNGTTASNMAASQVRVRHT